MKSLYKIIVTLLCFCSVLSCVEEITTEVDFEENIFIFGNLTNRSELLRIQIYKTEPLQSNNNFGANAVNDAVVSLFTKNRDKSIDLVTNDFFVPFNGEYISSQIIAPIVGNYYYIEVVLQDGTVFRSQEELLKKPVNLTGISEKDNMVRAEFSDPKDEINHYMVHFTFQDVPNNSSWEEFELSNDVLFNGNEKAFIETGAYGSYQGVPVTAILSNLNYDTYQFYLNVVAQNYSNEGYEDETGEPSRLFTPPPSNLTGNIVNISTGEFALGNFGVVSFSADIELESKSGTFAYSHINLINGISTSIMPNQTVVFDSATEEIIDIFSSGTKTLEEHIEVVDMEGKYMIPGLIEGHYHLASSIGEATGPGLASMKNMFKQGITSIRDMVGNGTAVKALQQMGKNKTVALPKVYFASLIAGKDFLKRDARVSETAGNGIAGQEPWFALLDDNTNVSTLINSAREFGCTALKLYADISPANAIRVLEEAHRQDFPIWSHGTLFSASPWDVVTAHSVSHADLFNYVTISPVPTEAEFYGDDYTEVFDLATIGSSEMLAYFNELKQNGTILEPTLSVYLAAGPEEQEIVNFAHALTTAAYLNGVNLGVGSDWANDEVTENNFLLLQEMKLLAQVTGMTNSEVIKAVTFHNAIALGIEQEYGSIEVNKKADMVILNANPLVDLNNLSLIERVVKDGVVYIIN